MSDVRLSDMLKQLKDILGGRTFFSVISENNIVFNESLKQKYVEVLEKQGFQNVKFCESLCYEKDNATYFTVKEEILAATFVYEFTKTLKKYRKDLLHVVYDSLDGTNSSKKNELKKSIIKARDRKSDVVKNLINSSNEFSDQKKKELIKFAYNYKSWGGGKEISRDDFYVSPVYDLVKIVQSQSSMINILKIFDKEESHFLYEMTKPLIKNISNRSNSIHPVKKINGENTIFYGAPGTGKSYMIDNLIKERYTNYDSSIGNKNIFRVTLHPEYSYSDFVGQLLPHTEENGQVDYEFIPGIFTDALKRAVERPNEQIYLVLEEMSRANVSAVFGDLFQLLDRKNGMSEYSINNSDIAQKVYGNPDHRVTIPRNMTIYGTVNTSDQNVFVMDTAFKRRFEWRYVSTFDGSFSEEFNLSNNPLIDVGEGVKVSWKELYQALNKFIVGELGLSEDKQIGPFFIKFEGRKDHKAHDLIRDKLLQYLWQDVSSAANAMYSAEGSLFIDKKNMASFSNLYTKFDKYEQVFSDKFLEKLGVTHETSSFED